MLEFVKQIFRDYKFKKLYPEFRKTPKFAKKDSLHIKSTSLNPLDVKIAHKSIVMRMQLSAYLLAQFTIISCACASIFPRQAWLTCFMLSLTIFFYIKLVSSALGWPKTKPNQLICPFLLIVVNSIYCFACLYEYIGLKFAGVVIHSFSEGLYFSIVTWTTLGYGDLTVPAAHHLLSAFQALLGSVAMPVGIALVWYWCSNRNDSVSQYGRYLGRSRPRTPAELFDKTFLRTGMVGVDLGRDPELPPANLLFLSSYIGEKRFVKKYLERGDPVNEINSAGWTALTIACAEGRIEIVQILLEHGADPNVINRVGFTPLTFAVGYGYLDIVELLLNNRANPNLYGPTAPYPHLVSAAKEGDFELVELLCNFGADPRLKNPQGEDAAMAAESNKHFALSRYLKLRSNALELLESAEQGVVKPFY